MKAVWRLNLLVTAVFLLALIVSVQFMIKQASRDIEREVVAGVSFAHQMLSQVERDVRLLEPFLNRHARHVRITILQPGEHQELDVDLSSGSGDTHDHSETGDVPEWFLHLIPEFDRFEERFQLRFLPDGRQIRIQGDPGDEIEEVWESCQQVIFLFFLAMLLSNLAIWFGVQQGLKPIEQFCQGLNDIQDGRLAARLEACSIPELNQVSEQFNRMAETLQCEQRDNIELTQQLMSIQEQERSWLARELHDDLGQYATGIKAQAFLIQGNVSEAFRAMAAEQIMQNCDAMQTSFRRLIHDLHPVILDQLALKDAFNSHISVWEQQHQIPCKVKIDDDLPSLTDEQNSHLFRILQEALNNIARHSRATQVVLVFMKTSSDSVQLTVSDNGQGMATELVRGFGLRSMHERARVLGGKLSLNSGSGQGMNLTVSIPLSNHAIKS